ncbi:hypothetical protein [Microbacterium rhizophilus]|uniref:hypothetical protein n=1 Tax=Microbacterium rhizophilus TaxID=3138934 RepID=UPI0031F152A8
MLDVMKSRELQATIFALRTARAEIRRDINKHARQLIRPMWREELSTRAANQLERQVIVNRASATPSDRGFKLRAATGGALSGGLVPSFEWQAAEFGMTPRRVTVEQRSRKGKRFTRTTTVGKQFRSRSSDGMIAFDAASKVGTRLVATWVRTVVEQLAKLPGAEVR